ncbi:unnamed protein product, partial [Vitis vinifera]
MDQPKGNWIKLDQNGTGPGARSSHAIAIVGQKAYVFGGELTPRVPVDNDIHVFDLQDLTWSVATVTGDVPPPRIGVGMAAVGGTIYVFGGRDGTHKELNELYSFDTFSNKWTLLSSGDAGPPHRSYHSIAADQRRVYVFGGCGETDDVHCFDLAHEKWAQVDTKGEKPSPRSVFSSLVIGKYIFIYGGEVDPSDQGHLGAGKFSGEVYALDTHNLVWKKWADTDDNHPGPRGWCAFSAGRLHDKEGLLVYGGNSPSNDRLDDIFFLSPCLDVNEK